MMESERPEEEGDRPAPMEIEGPADQAGRPARKRQLPARLRENDTDSPVQNSVEAQLAKRQRTYLQRSRSRMDAEQAAERERARSQRTEQRTEEENRRSTRLQTEEQSAVDHPIVPDMGVQSVMDNGQQASALGEEAPPVLAPLEIVCWFPPSFAEYLGTLAVPQRSLLTSPFVVFSSCGNHFPKLFFHLVLSSRLDFHTCLLNW
jgi:hypothetical protein